MQLYDTDRTARRTIADAIEVLRTKSDFSENSRAQIRTRELRLPTGDVTSLVQMVSHEIGWAVSLPTSAHFVGTRTMAPGPEHFNISRLEGAIVDSNGNVELSDGTYLHKVHVVPTAISSKVTEMEALIVHLVVACVAAQDKCYRYLHETALPGMKFLDYSTLPGLELPTLKGIYRYVIERTEKSPQLPRVSRQTVARVLNKCGMRLPRSGARSAPRAA
jgi:hypothetical protein